MAFAVTFLDSVRTDFFMAHTRDNKVNRAKEDHIDLLATGWVVGVWVRAVELAVDVVACGGGGAEVPLEQRGWRRIR
jgi:hypothetical protein